MGLIRGALRKLLDHELGVLGEEINAAEAANADLEVKLQSLQRRFDLLQNRVGMRLKRAPREDFQDNDDSMLRTLRNDEWPEEYMPRR